MMQRNKAGKAVQMVRRMFADADKQGVLKEVWTLVTALRGPDNNVGKFAGAARIRAYLVGRLSVSEFADVTFRNTSAGEDQKYFFRDTLRPNMNQHYQGHVDRAFAVLVDAEAKAQP